MMDEEIIKALELCIQNGDCDNCPLYECSKFSDCLKAILDFVIAQGAEIERLQKEYDIMRFTTAKRWVKEAKSEARKEIADKITEVFERYKHLHEHANKARNDVIETFDLREIEMQSVWDVMTLEKNDMAEYEEMGRLQNNIETIAQDRLLTELEKDFKKLRVVEEWQNV